jgi:hypothetical protein
LEDLVNIGAYTHGASALNDLAVRMNAKIMEFLKQKKSEPVSVAQARQQLADLYAVIERDVKLLEQQQRQNNATANGAKKK